MHDSPTVLTIPVVRSVLVVDDEEDIREVVAAALEVVAGWRVLQASSSETAIAAARDEQPDAILLDAQMPGMNGPATLQALRAHAELSSTPVIFLTARVQPADTSSLSQQGAVAVLAKPFDPLNLADQIAGILGWP